MSDTIRFQFDYEFVQGVYSTLVSGNNLFVAITGVKVIAVILCVLSFYEKFFGAAKLEDEKKPPLTPYDIFYALAIFALVASYDQLLQGLDKMLMGLESDYFKQAAKAKDLGTQQAEVKYHDKDWVTAIKETAMYLAEIVTDPFWWILKLLEAIFWVCDSIMYGVYVAERFFFLGVLRVFGGLCLAGLMVPKLKDWFWKWLNVYLAIYLVIIPYFLVNAFTNAIYDGAKTKLEGAWIAGSLTSIIILIFVVVLKYKLFKQAGNILFKIFS